MGTNNWKGQIKLFFLKKKKKKKKKKRITDAIGFYVSNSSHETSDAFQVNRCEKQWRHYLNNIFIVLEHLVWSTVKLRNDSTWEIIFYVQINKGHLRKVGWYSGQSVVSTYHNKDEDNGKKKITTKIRKFQFGSFTVTSCAPHMTDFFFF